MIPRVWKALDLIREVSDHFGNDDFHRTIAERQVVQQIPIPSGQAMMQKICEAIAYSQGARSNNIAELVKTSHFSEAFAHFNLELLAGTPPEEILKNYWQYLKYIRFKTKVHSIVTCAKILCDIEREHGSFAQYIQYFAFPGRIHSESDIDAFWAGFNHFLADMYVRKMPFFKSTTSLLQLLLDLDYDSVKPDLIIMRLARRIGMVPKETGDDNLRSVVRQLQEYSVQNSVSSRAMDWYMLYYGGQADAGRQLTRRFCPSNDECRVAVCTIGRYGYCCDFLESP